jgi:hypothetical protein
MSYHAKIDRRDGAFVVAIDCRLIQMIDRRVLACAPEQSDDTLIHHRRDTAHTNRPRPHHDLCSAWAARQQAFIALQ